MWWCCEGCRRSLAEAKAKKKVKKSSCFIQAWSQLRVIPGQVPEWETLNTLEEIEESDDLKGAEVAILEEPEESLHEIEAAAAEEEAATVATAIELPEPDLDYDSAIESDFKVKMSFDNIQMILNFFTFFMT